ncbi:hypothetical protein COHA_001010 [Chlorella ohadii]|uniref:Fe2OG dioxygenase domain-containing protein n=1 Tax=Chlorella ohadii TaxID=2649997 RepID=A0AAD5E023_9CHLO|nr:hypothetical protein COHA_001010 [Chlorella ohadii]
MQRVARVITNILKSLINTTDLSMTVYQYSKEYTRKYVDQAIYEFNEDLRLSLVEQRMAEIKQAFPHIAASGSTCLGVEATLLKAHPDWTEPDVFLGAMQDWQELVGSAMRDIYADNTMLPRRFAAMAPTLREHRDSLIGLDNVTFGAAKCLFYSPGYTKYRPRDVKVRAWTVTDNQTETAFRTAANVAPEYSLELITKETCSPRGRIDVVQEACPKPYHWDDIGPDSQCGACSHWKDSWGDIGYTSLAEAKAYATTLYNAMRERALNELPAKLEPFLAQVWSWQFFNPNNTASRTISQELRMGPFGTAARATQLVLPRTSVRPIAWDDDKAPRPLMRLIIFYAADASEAGQVRIKGVFMEWIAQGRMGQLINYYVLSDCWGYCEGDLKKSWARAAPPSYVTGIEVAYDDRVRSIKFNLTGGVQVAAGPADGKCNGAATVRKVECSTFDSSRLLPAAAFTNVTGQAEPALNLKTLSGTVHSGDRTIESLRIHYSVKRTVGNGCLAGASAGEALVFGNSSRAWMELVSWRPRAYVLHGFLSDEECDHLVKAAQPSLARSLVVSQNGTGVLDSVRTSSGTFLSKGLDSIVARIEARVSTATHLPVSHAENLQVLKYELGQEYKAHWDTIEVAPEVQKSGMFQNQRTLTLLMYLTDVEEGGETSFPAGRYLDEAAHKQPPYTECGSKGVAVKPRKGDALLFHSLHIDGKRKDAFSYHAGCPVVRGVKYSATSWAHIEPFLAGGAAAKAAPQPPSACRDNHASCPQWAKMGECDKNPVYMQGDQNVRGHCRLSCKGASDSPRRSPGSPVLRAGLLALAILLAYLVVNAGQSSPAVNGRPWTLRVSISGDAAAGDAAASAAVAQAGDADGLHLVAQEQQQVVDDVSQHHSAPATYQEAVAKCADQPDLACLTAASKLPLGKGQFRFPHAFIVGYQKSATTSLFATLIHHPDVLSAKIKEPEFFTDGCNLEPLACPADKQREYVLETMKLGEYISSGGNKAAIEGSTHYGRNGDRLAAGLAEVFPHLKVIISLREPISRALSMQAHMADVHEEGCLAASGADVAECALQEMPDYFPQLLAWLDAFPSKQVMLIQYENMTQRDQMEDMVADVKNFLGLDPGVGRSDIRRANTREQHLEAKGQLAKGEKAGGWKMQRKQYERLLAAARPDAQRVAELAELHGLIPSRKKWMQAWEAVWQETLAGCDAATGECYVVPNSPLRT